MSIFIPKIGNVSENVLNTMNGIFRENQIKFIDISSLLKEYEDYTVVRLILNIMKTKINIVAIQSNISKDLDNSINNLLKRLMRLNIGKTV